MLLRLLSDSPPAALLPVDVVLERHRRVGQVHFVRIMGRVPGKLQQKFGRRFLPRPRRLCSWRTPGGVPVAVDLRLHERICPDAHFFLPAILNAVAYMLAARRRRREHVAATEFKAKVAPYLVEAPEL